MKHTLFLLSNLFAILKASSCSHDDVFLDVDLFLRPFKEFDAAAKALAMVLNNPQLILLVQSGNNDKDSKEVDEEYEWVDEKGFEKDLWNVLNGVLNLHQQMGKLGWGKRLE